MNEAWIGAGASVAGGFVVGALLASATRRVLRAPGRRPEFRELSGPTATFLFWLAVATGVVVAVTTVEPQTIEDVPADLLAYVPRVFAAGLILLAGRAIAVVCAGATGRAVARALGRPSGPVAAVVRLGVNLAAVVLALSQLGVDTTVLVVLAAGLSVSFGLAFALLVGLGGKDVAREIAAGRYLRRFVSPGSTLRSSGVSGSVVALHPLTIEVLTDDGRRLHVPHTRLLGDVLEVDGGEPADF
jgi:Mechanosensitive ion channel